MAKPVDNSVRESAFAPASEPATPAHATPRHATPRHATPRHSGFLHPTGLQRPSGIAKAGSVAKVHLAEQANDVTAADTIRAANVTLEQESAQHLSIPLTLALHQRDHYINEWCRERESRQQDAAHLGASLDEERQRHQAELDVLREQLQEIERELAGLRAEPRTIIGVAPAQRAASDEVVTVTYEDLSLRASLEAAWLDVEDARTRLAAMEAERDQAIKEADDLRVELYDKLAAARDEVIEAENRLTDLQRAFDDAKGQWEDEIARLTAEVDEMQNGAQNGVQRALTPAGDSKARVTHAIVPPPRDSMPMPSDDAVAGATDVPHEYYAAPPVPAVAQSPLNAQLTLSAQSPLSAPPTLSALLGFEPEQERDSEPPDSQGAEAAIGRRSKGFGLRQLFRSSKPRA